MIAGTSLAGIASAAHDASSPDVARSPACPALYRGSVAGAHLVVGAPATCRTADRHRPRPPRHGGPGPVRTRARCWVWQAAARAACPCRARAAPPRRHRRWPAPWPSAPVSALLIRWRAPALLAATVAGMFASRFCPIPTITASNAGRSIFVSASSLVASTIAARVTLSTTASSARSSLSMTTTSWARLDRVSAVAAPKRPAPMTRNWRTVTRSPPPPRGSSSGPAAIAARNDPAISRAAEVCRCRGATTLPSRRPSPSAGRIPVACRGRAPSHGSRCDAADR